MFSFSIDIGELSRVFVGRGRYRSTETTPHVLQLSADYAFELIWNVQADGSLSDGRVGSPERTSYSLSVQGSRSFETLSYRVRPEFADQLLRENLRDWNHRGNVPISQLSAPLGGLFSSPNADQLSISLARMSRQISEPDPVVLETLDALRMRRSGRSLKDKLGAIGYSRSQISRRFRASTGVPMEFYSMLRQLLSAKEHYLAMNQASVDATAIATGYSDASHLGHTCSKLTGRSFRDFCANFNLPS